MDERYTEVIKRFLNIDPLAIQSHKLLKIIPDENDPINNRELEYNTRSIAASRLNDEGMRITIITGTISHDGQRIYDHILCQLAQKLVSITDGFPCRDGSILMPGDFIFKDSYRGKLNRKPDGTYEMIDALYKSYSGWRTEDPINLMADSLTRDSRYYGIKKMSEEKVESYIRHRSQALIREAETDEPSPRNSSLSNRRADDFEPF